VIVEASVRDKEPRELYSSQVGPILRKFSGEVLAVGPWLSLFGEPAFENGMVVSVSGQGDGFRLVSFSRLSSSSRASRRGTRLSF
jgi:hypothetical protein